MKEQLPFTGINGIKHHWRNDLTAAISVSLVALPLALGIALASGVPPMAGIIGAIIGGVVTTFFRGSYVAINGPAAGLIVVVLTGMETLEDGNGVAFPYVLAAIVVAGGIQVLLGLLKMGKLGDIFPASVVNGMLATIGITIFVKQLHLGLGVHDATGSIIHSISMIPDSLMDLNIIVTLITLISLIILILHPRIKSKFIKGFPGPLWVLIFAIPFVFIVDHLSSPDVFLLGKEIYILPKDLITIPNDILEGIVFPNFSKVGEPRFWMVVISILTVASIETLISTKAVDKLDQFKRRTNLNKDLFAVGMSTVVSGFLGGLPIITVIVRSSVNVNHNAKTKWSNFYHGILVFVFVFFFPFIINEIPQAALAAILIYTGYKLASPKVFRAAWMKGWEQLLILIVTILASLALNLLWGIIIGVFFTFIIHWLVSGLNFKTFVRHLRNTEINVVEESGDTVHVEIKGIANFAIVLRLIRSLEKLKNSRHYVVDFSKTKLIDSTILDFVHEHREKYFTESDFEFIGLDVHKTSSNHPLALHVLQRPMQKKLTGRLNGIFHFANEKGYRFYSDVDWSVEKYKNFDIFEFHLLEYRRNKITGKFTSDVDWTICDLTYNDGVMMASEQHHFTVMLLLLNRSIPEFTYKKAERKLIQTKVEAGAIEELSEIEKLIGENPYFNIECKGDRILLYSRERLLSTKEIVEMHDFAEKLVKSL